MNKAPDNIIPDLVSFWEDERTEIQKKRDRLSEKMKLITNKAEYDDEMYLHKEYSRNIENISNWIEAANSCE